MTEQAAISMEEPKQKLMALEEHLPDAPNDLVYDFAHFLAKHHLNPELIPQGFVIACELALYDLQTGVDGYTSQPIQSRLVGYPPMTYGLLRTNIPTIAKAIFPEEFAESVRTFMEEVNQKVREGEMTQEQVVELMKSSKSESEWDANCGKVKEACGGYPDFWFAAIIQSDVLDETRINW